MEAVYWMDPAISHANLHVVSTTWWRMAGGLRAEGNRTCTGAAFREVWNSSEASMESADSSRAVESDPRCAPQAAGPAHVLLATSPREL